METYANWLALIAAFVGLMAALPALFLSLRNANQLRQRQKDFAELNKEWKQAALELTILHPKDESELTGDVNDMEGTLIGELSFGYTLWVLASDHQYYYLMYPPVKHTIQDTVHKWSQTNIRVSPPGSWRLHVCIANESAAQWLRDRAVNDNWSGFPELPEGLRSLRSVRVKKM